MNTKSSNQPDASPSLVGKVSRLEDKLAILVLDDGQSLAWPIKYLPQDTEVGAEIKINLVTVKEKVAEKENAAKAILNSILNNDDN